MKITKQQLKQIIKEELSKSFGSEGTEVLSDLDPNKAYEHARDTAAYKHTREKGFGAANYYRDPSHGQLGYVSHDPVLGMVIDGMCKTMGKGDRCQPIYHHGDREYGFRINFGLFGPVGKRTEFGIMVDDLYDQISNELKPKA